MPSQGIFPTQGLNPHLFCLLHDRCVLYHYGHLEAGGSGDGGGEMGGVWIWWAAPLGGFM